MLKYLVTYALGAVSWAALRPLLAKLWAKAETKTTEEINKI